MGRLIEHIFTQQYYPGIDTDKQDHNRQRMSSGYSAIFIDLEDDVNQRTIFGGSTDFPDDDVRGYTPRQLQSAVEKSRNLESVRDQLRSKYNNETDGAELDDLFNFYIDIQ